MPKLDFVNSNSQIIPPRDEAWWVRLTTPEDHRAVKQLGLSTEINVPLPEQSARAVIDVINDRANQIRNPSGIYDRATMRM